MNAVRVSALALLTLFALLSGSHGQEAGKNTSRKLVVSGGATVQVNPDAARLTFAITAIDATAKKARDENDKQVKRIKDSLSALAIQNLDLQVLPSGGSTMVAGDPNPDGSPKIQGRQAQNVFYVTVREKNIDKLRTLVAKLADVAVENGATGFGNDDRFPKFRLPRGLGLGNNEPETLPGPKVEWLAENTGDATRTAIKKAVSEALANARAAAGQAEVKIVEISVTPGEANPYRAHSPFERNGPESGTIPVTVSVQVTYSY